MSFSLLWSHVWKSANPASQLVVVQVCRKAKIYYFHAGEVALVLQHNIRRLDISVHIVFRMNVLECREQTTTDLDDFIFSELFALSFHLYAFQMLTSQEFHLNRNVVISHHSVHLDDIGVVHLTEDICLLHTRSTFVAAKSFLVDDLVSCQLTFTATSSWRSQ